MHYIVIGILTTALMLILGELFSLFGIVTGMATVGAIAFQYLNKEKKA